MQRIKAGMRQSIFDLAVQYCGSVEAAMEIAVSNDLAIDAELTPGQELSMPDVRNQLVVSYYENNQLTPATGLDTQTPGEGIGYWIIENDFIVQ